MFAFDAIGELGGGGGEETHPDTITSKSAAGIDFMETSLIRVSIAEPVCACKGAGPMASRGSPAMAKASEGELLMAWLPTIAMYALS